MLVNYDCQSMMKESSRKHELPERSQTQNQDVHSPYPSDFELTSKIHSVAKKLFIFIFFF